MAEDHTVSLSDFLTKLAMAVIIFTVGIVCGSMPLFTGKMPVNLRDRILGICNAFASGIFLAAGFIHLFGEGIDLFSEVYPDLTSHYLNLALLLAPMGLVTTFIIDKVIFLKDDFEVHEHTITPPSKQQQHQHQHNEHKSHHHSSYSTSSSSSSSDEEGKDEKTPLVHKGGGHGHSHGLSLSAEGKPTLANFLLVAVLSFHSILSGFVIGLESDMSVAFTVFLALISHHWIESFALGASILRSKVATIPLLGLILFFSCMAPSGIIIGLIANFVVTDAVGELIEAYFISFTAGSFIYVAVVDILLEEFTIARDKWIKLIGFFIGFLADASIILISEATSGDSH